MCSVRMLVGYNKWYEEEKSQRWIERKGEGIWGVCSHTMRRRHGRGALGAWGALCLVRQCDSLNSARRAFGGHGEKVLGNFL